MDIKIKVPVVLPKGDKTRLSIETWNSSIRINVNEAEVLSQELQKALDEIKKEPK